MLSCERGKGFDNLLLVLTRCEHLQNLPNHNASSLKGRFSMAYVRISNNMIVNNDNTFFHIDDIVSISKGKSRASWGWASCRSRCWGGGSSWSRRRWSWSGGAGGGGGGIKTALDGMFPKIAAIGNNGSLLTIIIS